MKTPTDLIAWILFAACLMPAVVQAHPDDPKLRDRQPRYEGPGYRQSDGQRQPTGLAFPSSGLVMRGWITLPQLDSYFGMTVGNANDCWGYVSPSGREYAILGTSAGTAYIEVTNPGDPIITAVVNGPGSLWRDIKVYQHYAYAVSEGGGGIQVMDLSDIDSGSVTLLGSVNTPGSSNTHNVVINPDSGYLYRTGGSGTMRGLRIYDLSDPVNPSFVGSWDDRYVHDAQVVSFTEGKYAGREIAFCCAGFNGGGTETGLSIVDVTDKNNIFMVGPHYQYPGNAYSHQAWLTADRQHILLNDEQDETSFGIDTTMHIIDVADLGTPVEVASYSNGTSAITHNLYTVGDLVFASNYRSGLRVFDVSDPLAPMETAFFDTYPESDSANFNGLWSNYPYLPSGVILGSDIEKGLFVWEFGQPLLSYAFPEGLPELLDPASGVIQVEIQDVSGQVDPATAALHYDVGAGFVQQPMIHVGGSAFEAVFPELPCGATVAYFFSAQTTDGVTVQNPTMGAGEPYEALAVSTLTAVVQDNMEVDLGWSTENVDGATAGMWERGVPVNDPGWAYDPQSDADGSGQCYLTQNTVGNSDVDNGTVRLTSPLLDLSGGAGAIIRYDYYLLLTNADGIDQLAVEISSDGLQWVEVARHDNNGGSNWHHHVIGAAELAGVTLSSDMRLRFTVNDGDPQSIVEAGLDAFEVASYSCPSDGVLGDLTGDGVVDPADLALLLGAWGDCSGCAADLNDNGVVDAEDLAMLLGNWG